MQLVRIRRFEPGDTSQVWALNSLPNVGFTADPWLPLNLPLPEGPPANFPDLADVEASFIQVGGDFLVVEVDGSVVGMGGFRPTAARRAEVLRVRVHPATRRRGIGRKLMEALETRATEVGVGEFHLDTATNQPEAVAFYRGIGYEEIRQESRPEWSWTLVYFVKCLYAIQPARPDDLLPVARLIDRKPGLSEDDLTERHRATWARMLLTDDLSVYLAWHGDDAVGTTALLVMPHITYACRPTAFIESMYVRDEHRRRGVARRMVERLLVDAEKAGCHKVQLLTHKRHAQDGAHAFYRSLGFEAEAEGFRMYLDGAGG